ncbi:fasting-inducible integral membrane protein tm6p1-related [Anaeramoeba flamelloides]|uniref:Fasting-inducible integral membrane protein tm6p1-related n=1 Tax=Anaeramoeba flamelloides TaxID=1746091 RepID=A0AAV7Z4Y1_9EUKA|nr:fasting-inducible integral membrane protein tm6p1-related [Anaeramoeba flamelloides]KAJ6251738.1 fasting-inducible integral membrane protein tm6p1-related [Anaeramoeba flamelloides]
MTSKKEQTKPPTSSDSLIIGFGMNGLTWFQLILTTSCISICHVLNQIYRRNDLTIPFISLLFNHPVEHLVSSTLLTTTAFINIFTAFINYMQMSKRFPKSDKLLLMILVFRFLSGSTLIVSVNVPLQTDWNSISSVGIFSLDEFNHKITIFSRLHLLGLNSFFLSCAAFQFLSQIFIYTQEIYKIKGLKEKCILRFIYTIINIVSLANLKLVGALLVNGRPQNVEFFLNLAALFQHFSVISIFLFLGTSLNFDNTVAIKIYDIKKNEVKKAKMD